LIEKALAVRVSSIRGSETGLSAFGVFSIVTMAAKFRMFQHHILQKKHVGYFEENFWIFPIGRVGLGAVGV